MLLSLGALLVMFTWVGYILFSRHYLPTNSPSPPPPLLGSRSRVAFSGRFFSSDGDEKANVNVDLSTFPRALQSLFVLLTSGEESSET
jgi:hypothetical protein